jgi:hypothetical protein
MKIHTKQGSDCKSRRLRPEIERLYSEGKKPNEIAELVGLHVVTVKKVLKTKEKFPSNSKSERAKPIILEMADKYREISEIAEKTFLHENTVKKVLKRMGFDLKVYNNKSKRLTLERNVIEEVKKNNNTYNEIGLMFGVSKNVIIRIAHNNSVRRYEKDPEKYKKMVKDILTDIENGIPMDELKRKYNLNDKRVYNNATSYGLPPLARTYREIRDKEITRQYKTKIARIVLKSDAPEMDSPERLQNVAGIYRSSSRNGFKKYPKIGDRHKGGLFVEPEVIKIIKREKKKKKTNVQIAELLNKKGFISPMGNPYNHYMVNFKWAKIKKLNL